MLEQTICAHYTVPYGILFIYLYIGICICIGDAVLVVVCSKYFRCFCVAVGVAESMMMYLLWYGPNVFACCFDYFCNATTEHLLIDWLQSYKREPPLLCMPTDRDCSTIQGNDENNTENFLSSTNEFGGYQSISYIFPMEVWIVFIFCFKNDLRFCLHLLKRISLACILHMMLFIDWKQGAYASFESK